MIKLKEIQSEMEFCMFTVFEESDKVFQSLQAGATGYILKHAAPVEILQALKELVAGGSPMNPIIARKVITEFGKFKAQSEANAALEILSDREQEILSHLSQGMLYKEIGTELGITTGTVKQHIHKIYKKLQVNNRTEAINKYLGRD